jgi:exosortase
MQKSDLTLLFRGASLIAILGIFYWQDLTAIFVSAWSDAEVSYLFAIPILVSFLVWRKRKVIGALIGNPFEEQTLGKNRLPTISGALLCATAVFLYFYGAITFTPLEYHLLTLPIFTTGLILLFFNPATLRHLAFPVLFLFFLVPPPTTLYYAAGSFLADISAHASASIVTAFGMPSTVTYLSGNPNVVMMNGGQPVSTFIVDFTCSGINGLITFVVFTVFLAYIVRDKFWKKIAVIAVGLPLIYFLNIIRIAILLAAGFNYGAATVESFLHPLSGLILTFFGALFLALIAQKALKANFYASTQSACLSCSTGQSQPRDFCESCGRVLKKNVAKVNQTDLKKIFTMTFIVVLLLLVQAPIYALATTQTNVLAQMRSGQDPSTNILPQIDGYTLNYSVRDTQFELENHQDAAITYCYNPTNSSLKPVWVVLEIATSSISMHAWETCLINYPLSEGNQPSAKNLDLREVQVTSNPPITARLFAFQWSSFNVTQVVMYWHETLMFASNSSAEQKNMQISLSVYPSSADNIQDIEQQLQAVARPISTFWEPIKEWTPVAILLSQYANILAAVTLISLASAISAFYYFKIKGTPSGKIAYSKTSEQDKKVIAALQETQKRRVSSTINSIQESYQTLNNPQISETDLISRLQGLSHVGLIRHKIISVNDVPIVCWEAENS